MVSCGTNGRRWVSLTADRFAGVELLNIVYPSLSPYLMLCLARQLASCRVVAIHYIFVTPGASDEREETVVALGVETERGVPTPTGVAPRGGWLRFGVGVGTVGRAATPDPGRGVFERATGGWRGAAGVPAGTGTDDVGFPGGAPGTMPAICCALASL